MQRTANRQILNSATLSSLVKDKLDPKKETIVMPCSNQPGFDILLPNGEMWEVKMGTCSSSRDMAIAVRHKIHMLMKIKTGGMQLWGRELIGFHSITDSMRAAVVYRYPLLCLTFVEI